MLYSSDRSSGVASERGNNSNARGNNSEGSERSDRISVLIADDQELVRSGFAAILGTYPDFEVVGLARNGTEAVELAKRLVPDVVLMDIRMPEMDGLSATREITSDPRLVNTHVLVLTTFDIDQYVYDALTAGASGFLLKDADPDEMANAIRVVARGDALIQPSVMRRLVETFVSARQQVEGAAPGEGEGAASNNGTSVEGETSQGAEAPGSAPAHPDPARFRSQRAQLRQLTDREREILALVARGFSNDQIAEALFISPATVKTHVSRIMSKTLSHDRAQLVVFAYESGLVATPV